MEAVQRNRVKVYQLNDQGGWDDKGTGYVHGELIDVRPSRRPRRDLVAHTRRLRAAAAEAGVVW